MRSLVLLLLLIVGLDVLIVLSTAILTDWVESPLHWRWLGRILIFCSLAAFVPAALIGDRWTPRRGTTIALAVMVFRLHAYLGFLVFLAATKWPGHDWAANTLVGCYFPFLLLESGHFIRLARRN